MAILTPARMAGRRQRGVTGRLRLRNGREMQADRGPARQHALGLDASAVRLHQVLHDGEPDARPALVAGPPLVYATEPLEDTRQLFRCDAGAGGAHRTVY